MVVSHDFRTPIALIRGYAEALRDQVARDRETEERYLSVSKDKTGQLEALVDDLLGYARMESDQRRADPPRVELRDFFHRLATEFAEDAEMSGRRFVFHDGSTGEIFASLETKVAERAFPDQAPGIFRSVTDDEHSSGITEISVHNCCHIDIDDVPILKHGSVRNAVTYDIVD